VAENIYFIALSHERNYYSYDCFQCLLSYPYLLTSYCRLRQEGEALQVIGVGSYAVDGILLSVSKHQRELYELRKNIHWTSSFVGLLTGSLQKKHCSRYSRKSDNKINRWTKRFCVQNFRYELLVPAGLSVISKIWYFTLLMDISFCFESVIFWNYELHCGYHMMIIVCTFLSLVLFCIIYFSWKFAARWWSLVSRKSRWSCSNSMMQMSRRYSDTSVIAPVYHQVFAVC